MTINNNPGLSEFGDWNEYNLNLLTSNNWRASLVPAAAVIPAPIAYIKVVAVKKLVVGCLASGGGPLHGEYLTLASFARRRSVSFTGRRLDSGPLL